MHICSLGLQFLWTLRKPSLNPIVPHFPSLSVLLISCFSCQKLIVLQCTSFVRDRKKSVFISYTTIQSQSYTSFHSTRLAGVFPHCLLVKYFMWWSSKSHYTKCIDFILQFLCSQTWIQLAQDQMQIFKSQGSLRNARAESKKTITFTQYFFQTYCD